MRYQSGIEILMGSAGLAYHCWFRGEGTVDFNINVEGRQISASWTRSRVQDVITLLLVLF